MGNEWMIYGSYGYTGELVVREAVRRGLRPVIAGRSGSKLAPLADELGLEYRAFDVGQASAHLHDIGVMVNCAGPFSSTAKPLVEACLETRTHYVDITGEIPVFEMCHGLDARAKAAGVVLCPGAGFDIVPTDCLAAMLKERMPGAVTIDLAFSFGTRPSIGTARTIVEGAEAGGLIRRNHRMQQVANGYRIRRIPFPVGARWAVTIPWGDVYTADVSTGVPNGMVYTALPLALGVLMRVTNPLRRLLATGWAQSLLNRVVDRMFGGGPDAQARADQRTEFWGEATDAAGNRLSVRMTAPNVYALTVDTALEIAGHCLSATDQAGYFTPSMLLGSQFIASRAGVDVEW
ncbi:saccharopine dehydrogenase family protein [Serratia sp. CY47444]|uniref:saccharopine dehydrogenase family protein n=1 Tax=Serratia sp. CY47444 TaxID=3383626 RepID=UPI003FA11FAD